MTVGATLALFVPSLVSYLMLRRMSGALLGGALSAAMAPGLGVGFASCVYFALLHMTANRGIVVGLDAGLWLAAAVCLLTDGWRRSKSVGGRLVVTPASAAEMTTSASPRAEAPDAWTPAIAVTAAGLLILCALALFAFWLRWSLRPEGEWDAFAIWNLRARAIARGAPDWTAIFSPALEWSSPHYPLLVPLSIARLWSYTGRESTAAPAVVALLFFLSSLAVIVTGVARLRGWPAGLLSGMTLLIARTYVFQSACQCGDIPVGFYILVAIALAAMSLREAKSGPLLVTAGAAAGLAAWTKDEGLPLVAIVILVAALRRSRLRALTQVAMGAAVPVVTLAAFKLHIQTSHYLFSQGGGVMQKLVDRSRWMSVAEGVVELGAAWGAVPGGAFVCLALAVALTARADRSSAICGSAGLLLVAAMMFAYGLVYVITPLPLQWQMGVSFNRLVGQLWPALVWAAFQFSGPLALRRV